jgi:hypothetical protein
VEPQCHLNTSCAADPEIGGFVVDFERICSVVDPGHMDFADDLESRNLCGCHSWDSVYHLWRIQVVGLADCHSGRREQVEPKGHHSFLVYLRDMRDYSDQESLAVACLYWVGSFAASLFQYCQEMGGGHGLPG